MRGNRNSDPVAEMPPAPKTFEWMGITCPLFDQHYPRVVIPTWNLRDSQQVEAKKAWEREEMRRCVHGHGPFCGSFYFYYHYCWIQDNRENFQPDLRMTDNLRFIMEEKAKAENTGYVMPKKRRLGATWGSCAFDLHGLLFWPNQRFGYASESEVKSRDYLVRMKYIYANLPDFLKQGMGVVTDTIKHLRFGTEKEGKNGDTLVLHDSNMLVAAPSVKAWEHFGYGRVKQDEAGKIDISLRQWISFTKPILAGRDSITRNGYMGIFGAVGEMEGAAGKEFEEVYDEAASHDLMQFWVPGSFGMFFDEFGNDDIERAIEHIEGIRKKIRNKKDEIEHRQQYPLSIEDCFTKSSNKYFFDVAFLDAAKSNITKAAPELRCGTFVMNSHGEVQFQDHHDGLVKILEEPLKGIPNAYVLGLDPIDNDADPTQGNIVSRFVKNKGKGKDQSDLSFVVHKRKTLLGPNHYPVCMFTGRLPNVKDAYYQTVCAAKYYGCMINPESNKRGFIIWCEERGYQRLLMRGTHKMPKAKRTEAPSDYGYNRDGSNIDQVCHLQEEWLKEYWEWLMFGEIEDSYRMFGNKNADLCCAHGAALLGSRWFDLVEAKGSKNMEYTKPNGHILPLLRTKGGIKTWT